MYGAQAEGCSPVAQAFAAGTDVCRPVKPDTIAKSLAIGNPADGPYAVELARRTGGAIEAVTDDEIRAGIRLLAETTGIFTETAGGVTTAVLAKLAERGAIDPDERVVAYITGDGLKTLDAVRDSVRGRARSRRRSRRSRRRSRRRRWPDGGHGQAPDAAARRRRRRGRGAGRRRDGRRGARRASTPSTASCASGSPTTTASLRRFVNVYLGGRGHPLPRRPRRRPSRDGDELTILPAVAGG